MKLFYSEFNIIPEFSSYGYSVYCRCEPEDNPTTLYSQGFVPANMIRNQPDLWYMARGSRVVLSQFSIKHELRRIQSKFDDSSSNPVSVKVWRKEDFDFNNEVLEGMEEYFTRRHGKGSMPRERLEMISTLPALTHISEYSIRGTVVGYLFETHTDSWTHFWYLVCTKEYDNTNFGVYMVLDLVKRSQSAGKEFVHLGVTCGWAMRYKTNFQPLEYWNGHEWVNDPKSKKLRTLLRTDSTRKIGFVDEWRENQELYCPPPYPFHSTFAELRYALFILYSTPRALIVFASLFTFFVLCFLYLSVFH